MINQLMATVAKSSLTILMKSLQIKSSKVWKILFRTPPTTLFQIFCKIIQNSKDIVKNIKGTDLFFCFGSVSAFVPRITFFSRKS